MIIFFVSLWILFFGFHPLTLYTENRTTLSTIGQTFAGEELHYEIDFWLIPHVADVTLSFSQRTESGKYVITLSGKTRGVIGYALRHREDYYRAVVEEIDNGRKLRTIYYEEQIRIGPKRRRNEYIFDHTNRKWIERNYKNGTLRKEIVREIPPKAEYNDFLTAAYNFRYGVYGQIVNGGVYLIPVFPRKDVDHYEVKVANPETRNLPKDTLRGPDQKAFFVELKVDPEIVNSSKGLIEGWLSPGLYPFEGVIRDVFFFGDVRGRLVKTVTKN